MADDPKPLRAHVISFRGIPPPLKGQTTDEALLKAAFDEAVTEVRDHEVGENADVRPEDWDLFIRYRIQGKCTDALEGIAKRTRCPALRDTLDLVCQFPRISRLDLSLREPDS